MSAVLEQIAASIGREVTTADVLRLLNELDDAGRNEVDQLIASGSLPVWVPQPGPQTAAYNSPADVLFYGGSAGGGISDLPDDAHGRARRRRRGRSVTKRPS